MVLKPKDVISLAVMAGMGYGIYKLYKYISAIGDSAGKGVEKAYLEYMNITNPSPNLTDSAKSRQDFYISQGYMKKVYSPYPDCELSSNKDACYKYVITPKGNAYIKSQANARSQNSSDTDW